MKIYISGPITGTTDYYDRFYKAEFDLKVQGHEVINPARVNELLPESTTYDQYMEMCYLMIDMADAIQMLTGWEKSKGACIEFGYAKARGKTITYQDRSEHIA